MKFKAPEGCSSASVGGETFNVDSDGNITVPDSGDYLTLLAPHGFTVAEDQSAVKEPVTPVLASPEPDEEEAFNPLEEIKPQSKQNGKRK